MLTPMIDRAVTELGSKDPSTRHFPISAGDLEALMRWIPQKERGLLLETCERARLDPDFTRPALLLCSAYGETIARMLDQDPFPAVTRKIAVCLEELSGSNGL